MRATAGLAMHGDTNEKWGVAVEIKIVLNWIEVPMRLTADVR